MLVSVVLVNPIIVSVTTGGLQREVIMLPGPLVSLVGEGDTLLLVTHAGHQALAYSLYRVGVSGVTLAHPASPTLPLPLSPGKS